ncbi:hypothetical protein [Pseudochryseolinea flava]|nr:hypothetical protein [Pseudochryseolinea flava]
MKNNVKSLFALMVIVFAAVSCSGKSEKTAADSDSATVAPEATPVDTTTTVSTDSLAQDSVIAK